MPWPRVSTISAVSTPTLTTAEISALDRAEVRITSRRRAFDRRLQRERHAAREGEEDVGKMSEHGPFSVS